MPHRCDGKLCCHSDKVYHTMQLLYRDYLAVQEIQKEVDVSLARQKNHWKTTATGLQCGVLQSPCRRTRTRRSNSCKACCDCHDVAVAEARLDRMDQRWLRYKQVFGHLGFQVALAIMHLCTSCHLHDFCGTWAEVKVQRDREKVGDQTNTDFCALSVE